MKADNNDLMQYLNVSLGGLRGRPHPCLSNIVKADEVKKLRPHLKFLTGDYLTYKRKFEESTKGSPLCRLCQLENESILHILAICPIYDVSRTRILKEFEELCPQSLNFYEVKSDPKILAQFVLDPTSFNLQKRVNIRDPIVPALFKLSRDFCNAIHTQRIKKLRDLAKET